MARLAPAEPISNARSAETRQRLLQAAGEVFADRGYRDATVREICRRARANVAAINYHFGDKSRLYLAVLDFTARFAFEKYPPAPLPEGSPPRDRLASFIRNHLDRLLDEGRPAWHGKLLSREMVDPTGALDHLVPNFIRPQFDRLCATIAELLGPSHGSDPAVLRRCAFSVVGQCMFYKHARPVIDRLAPDLPTDAAGRAALADHILTVCMAGFESLRRVRAKPAEGRP